MPRVKTGVVELEYETFGDPADPALINQLRGLEGLPGQFLTELRLFVIRRGAPCG